MSMPGQSSSVGSSPRVAVIDDDASVRLALRNLLRSNVVEVELYDCAEDYLREAADGAACLIVDIGMPGLSGPELVQGLRASGQLMPAIFISALDAPVSLVRGAGPSSPRSEFLKKPFGDDVLLAALDRALATTRRAAHVSATPLILVHKQESTMDRQSAAVSNLEELPRRAGFSRLVGHDGGLAATVHAARLLTKVSTPILLQGETGVGKQALAQAIHESGPLAESPFVMVSCAGLPSELLARELFGHMDSELPGKLEAAQGGTLFLDDIADLPAELQPYLLRVLESGELYPVGSTKPRPVSFRLISACNRDLRADATAERFRQDLFFRVSVTTLVLPPLRERKGDLEALVGFFERETAARHEREPKSCTPEVLAAFAAYSWPGNVRELGNVIESMSLLSEGDEVDLRVLPSALVEEPRLTLLHGETEGVDGDVEMPRGLQRIERAAIGEALRAYNGNLTRVARELQIARSTLYLKLKKYSLESVLDDLRVGTR